MSLSDRDLLLLIESEKAMERYLREYGQNPQDIDNRIWKIHFRATKKKQMGVLNAYFNRLLIINEKRYCLPHEMLVANVYKELNIPFKWNMNNNIVKPDSAKSKHRHLDKFQRRYNMFPKSYSKIQAKMGPYAFDESMIKPIIRYSDFKRSSLANVSNQPSVLEQRTSLFDKSKPAATSTPSRQSSSTKKSANQKPFSDITNELRPKTSEKSTPGRHAEDTSRTSGRVPLAVFSAAFKTKTTTPIEAEEQRRIPTSKPSLMVESKESRIEENVSNDRLAPAEIHTANEPHDDESTTCHNISKDFLTDEGEDSVLLAENINGIEKRMESILGSLYEDDETENRRKDASPSKLTPTRGNTFDTSKSNPLDVADLTRILEGASGESDSASTSSHLRGNTSALDLYPPLPVLITNSRELAVIAEVHENREKRNVEIDEIQTAPDASLPEERVDCLENFQTTKETTREDIEKPSLTLESLKVGDETRTKEVMTNLAADEDLNIQSPDRPHSQKSRQKSPTTDDEEIPDSNSASQSRLQITNSSTSKRRVSRSILVRNEKSRLETTGSQSSTGSRESARKQKSQSSLEETEKTTTPKTKTRQALIEELLQKFKKLDRSTPKQGPHSSKKGRTPTPKSSFKDSTASRATQKSTASRKSSVDSPSTTTSPTLRSSQKAVQGVEKPTSQTACRKSPSSSPSSYESTTRSSRNTKNSRLPVISKPSSSQLINDDDEDDIFREPTSQSRAQRKSSPANVKPKTGQRQDGKKLKTIVERVECEVTKKDTAVPSEESPPKPPVTSSTNTSGDRRVRRLFTDMAVIREERRRVRMSKKRGKRSLPSTTTSDSEMFSAGSSQTPQSYVESVSPELFETISQKLDTMNLKPSANKTSADEKTDACKKSSSSFSPSLFGAEGDKRSTPASEKKHQMSLRSSRSLSVSPQHSSKTNVVVASQFSNSSYVADDECSDLSLYEPMSLLTPLKEPLPSRTLRSNSSTPSSISRCSIATVREMPKSRQSPSKVVAESDSEMEVDGDDDDDSPRSKSSIDAVETFFDAVVVEPATQTPPPSASVPVSEGDETSLDSTMMNRKVEQFLAGSTMETDDDDDSPVLKSSMDTAIERYDEANEHSKSVSSPRTSCPSTKLDSDSSVSVTVRSKKRDSRLEEEDDIMEDSPDKDSPTSVNMSPDTAFNELLRRLDKDGSPNYLSRLASKSSSGSTSPASTVFGSPSPDEENSPKLSPTESASYKDTILNSPVLFGRPTNRGNGKRRSTVEMFEKDTTSPPLGQRHIGGNLTKKRSGSRFYFPSDLSSEDDENPSPRSANLNVPKSTVSASPKLKNSERVTSPVAMDVDEIVSPTSRTSAKLNASNPRLSRRKRTYLSTDDEYNTDELNAFIQESYKRRENLTKKSQEETAAEDSDEDPTKDIFQLFERAKSHKREQPGNSNEKKSASPSRAPDRPSLDMLREAQWNTMPSSVETAATTAEEKLQMIRETFQKESFENYTNSLDLAELFKSQPVEKDLNYMSDDDFL